MGAQHVTPIASRVEPTTLLAIGASATVGLYVVDPTRTRIPLCPLHAATGLWCPLCGATRATHALLHGDLMTALHDNALYVSTLPLLLFALARWYVTWPDAGRRVLPRPVVLALLASGLVFGIVRNLPVGHVLAPPG